MQGRQTTRRSLATQCKRSVAAMLLATLTTASVFAEAERAAIARGDLDRDGMITEADLMIFTEWYYEVTPARSLESMDVDDNGRIDGEDYEHMHKVVYFHPRTLPEQAEIQFERGDTNGDGRIDLADVVALVGLLHGRTIAAPMDAADVDHDGFLTPADAQELLSRIFTGETNTGPGRGGE